MKQWIQHQTKPRLCWNNSKFQWHFILWGTINCTNDISKLFTYPDYKNILLILKLKLYTSVAVFSPFRIMVWTKKKKNWSHNIILSKSSDFLQYLTQVRKPKPVRIGNVLVSTKFNFKSLQITTSSLYLITFASSGGRGGAGGSSFGGGGGGFPLVGSDKGRGGAAEACSTSVESGTEPSPSFWFWLSLSCFNFCRFSRCLLYQRFCCS